jgi:hypothetical protein
MSGAFERFFGKLMFEGDGDRARTTRRTRDFPELPKTSHFWEFAAEPFPKISENFQLSKILASFCRGVPR